MSGRKGRGKLCLGNTDTHWGSWGHHREFPDCTSNLSAPPPVACTHNRVARSVWKSPMSNTTKLTLSSNTFSDSSLCRPTYCSQYLIPLGGKKNQAWWFENEQSEITELRKTLNKYLQCHAVFSLPKFTQNSSMQIQYWCHKLSSEFRFQQKKRKNKKFKVNSRRLAVASGQNLYIQMCNMFKSLVSVRFLFCKKASNWT